jgi:hypothetical protein
LFGLNKFILQINGLAPLFYWWCTFQTPHLFNTNHEEINILNHRYYNFADIMQISVLWKCCIFPHNNLLKPLGPKRCIEISLLLQIICPLTNQHSKGAFMNQITHSNIQYSLQKSTYYDREYTNLRSKSSANC